MFDPEAIEVALFTLIETNVKGLGFKTVSRRPRTWSQVGNEGQPALFLAPLGFTITQDQLFGPSKYVLHYMVLVYTRADEGSTTPPQTLLNRCMKAVNDALQQQPKGYKQTLGGLVENAWIEGEVPMGSGILDPQCALEIPIRALTGI
jgi:hypothetical protein